MEVALEVNADAEIILKVTNKAKTDAEAANQLTILHVKKAKYAQADSWMSETLLEEAKAQLYDITQRLDEEAQ